MEFSNKCLIKWILYNHCLVYHHPICHVDHNVISSSFIHFNLVHIYFYKIFSPPFNDTNENIRIKFYNVPKLQYNFMISTVVSVLLPLLLYKNSILRVLNIFKITERKIHLHR